MLQISNRVEESNSIDLAHIKNRLLRRLRSAVPNQEHLVAHWDQLDDIAKSRLATQIDEIDFDLLFGHSSASKSSMSVEVSYQPPPVVTLEEQAQCNEAIALGERCLHEGRVGVALVAGGMGTRLGFEDPKGMYPIGPVSGHTLFQILLERIVGMSRRYGVRIPLYLMTSQATHSATMDFLQQHDAFGLDFRDVHVFCQGTLPAIDAETLRILLSEHGAIASCPDGHGGFVEAARRSGTLDDMKRRGIDVLFYGQIDNPLLPIADPMFIGQHLRANADISAMVVKRASLSEKVGLFVSTDEKICVVEYSELPEQVATAVDIDGSPVFWAGNMAVHAFSVNFLNQITARPNMLPAHPCRKKVDFIDSNGMLRQPTQPNAIKFERFIFDLMHHTDRTVLVEADRTSTFAPVKNPDSMTSDTPATARAAMVAQHAKWLQDAHTDVAPGVAVEISPLFALDGAELARKQLPATIESPTYLA